ncbi:MAG: aminotransferase class I/II-fold pyridoxal phosphate-dependent enzyme [Cyclobacteriaceae bacterium]
MTDKRIYLSPPVVGEAEKKSLSNAIDSGWVAPAGPQLDQFERQLEEMFSGRRVLGVNSGTSALHLALRLLDIKPGDKVLVATFTFTACAASVRYLGAVPVFLDSEKETWNLDPAVLSEYLKNSEQKPKALIVTHLYGMPARIQEIKDICEEFGIDLIEDAAEAMGSVYKDHFPGSFGKFGIVSFNGNKIVTTSGGGILITDDNGYDHGKYLSTQANSERYGYDHNEVGYNYRLSNVLASIGVAQLSRLDEFIQRKREIFAHYKAHLSADVFEFHDEAPGSYSNRWLTTPLIRSEYQEKVKPLELIRFLDDRNIECRQLWKPLHLHGAYSAFEFVGTGVAEKIFMRGLCLPSGSSLSTEQQDYVITHINEYLTSV